MVDFLSNFSPNRSDLEPTPNEQIMGQNKHQEVLAALLLSIDLHGGHKKEKRIAWKTAFTKAKHAYLADYEFTLAAAFVHSLERERNDAFKHAFSKLHDEVSADRENWSQKAENIPVFLNNSGEAYLKSMVQRASDAPEDSDIVRVLQSGRDNALSGVYAQYRDYFIGFANKQFSKADLDTVTDVYQDAWIVIIKYVNDQKIRVVQDGNGGELLIGLRNKASIKTLLTAIGANMLKNGNDDLLKQSPAEPDPNMPDTSVEALDGFSEEDHDLLYRALETLDEKCQFLLACRYWFQFPYKEIQDWTDAPSEVALRTQTNRCKRYLTRAFEKLQGNK